MDKYNASDTDVFTSEDTFNNIAELAKDISGAECVYVVLEGKLKSVIPASKTQVNFIIDRVNQQNTHLQINETGDSFQIQYNLDAIQIPIINSERKSLGLLGILMQNPVELSDRQVFMLNNLAKLISEKQEVRNRTRRLFQITDDRLHVLIHDLKNSMTTISLQAELMEKLAAGQDKLQMIAGKMNLQSKNITEAFNQILSAAKREDHNYKPNKTKFQLEEVLLTSIRSVQHIIEEKKQNIVFATGDNPEIFADFEKLSEIFKSILKNASKFSNGGSKITVNSETENQKVTISIRDEGLGLPEEDIDKLFFKFAQLSSFPTDNENTEKLGLPLAKLLVDMHRGKIWAESTGKNQGTTFYVELPLK
ncbi:sensor histidine kinase [Pedobacter sp. AW1-32]|uniref:sensor histidine kinase n=1 Tax=Pedobacter sp. AW1-32 TaxID=3383026 RepID=UPI003FF0E0C0